MSSLINKHAIDPHSIGRVEISTRSLSTNVIVNHLYSLLSSLQNDDVNVVVSNQAADALLNTVNWVESLNWDGRFAVVVIDNVTDVHVMLIGPDAPIVLDRTSA
jgi:hydroxymethylglutaryl-CoA synthase